MAPFTGGVQLHAGAGFVVSEAVMKKTKAVVAVATVEQTPAEIVRAHHAKIKAEVEAEFAAMGIEPIYEEHHQHARCGVGFTAEGHVCRYSVSASDGVAVQEITLNESARIMAVLAEARDMGSPDPGTWHSGPMTEWLYKIHGSF